MGARKLNHLYLEQQGQGVLWREFLSWDETWETKVRKAVYRQLKGQKKTEEQKEDIAGEVLSHVFDQIGKGRIREWLGVERTIHNKMMSIFRAENTAKRKADVTEITEEIAPDPKADRDDTLLAVADRYPWLAVVTAARQAGIPTSTIARAFEMSKNELLHDIRVEQEKAREEFGIR